MVEPRVAPSRLPRQVREGSRGSQTAILHVGLGCTKKRGGVEKEGVATVYSYPLASI
jgi:hypothetical protein